MPPSLQQRLGVLNSAATFKLQKDPSNGATLSKRAYLNIKHALSPTKSGRRLWQTWRGSQDWLQRHVSMPLLRFGVKVNRMGLYLMARAEQAPNPDSRVRLSADKDALGCRRADLDWRLSALDKETMLQFGKTLEREFDRLGLGKVTTYEWLEDGTPDWPVDASVGNHPIGGYHHMGTTRMSTSARNGIVDANCTVHGDCSFISSLGPVPPDPRRHVVIPSETRHKPIPGGSVATSLSLTVSEGITTYPRLVSWIAEGLRNLFVRVTHYSSMGWVKLLGP